MSKLINSKIKEFREKFVEEYKMKDGGWGFKISSHPLMVTDWLQQALSEVERESYERGANELFQRFDTKFKDFELTRALGECLSELKGRT